MIIGLTGSIAAGKEVISNFLKEKGFVYFSLSQQVREIAKTKGIELTRKNLQDLGDALREMHGSEILAKLVLEKINDQEHTKVIIDGIRNPAEVIELKKIKDFFLISVDAPQKIRFERMFKRDRESDPKTFEDFLKVDERDKGFDQPETGQGVAKCMEKADFTLMNDKTIGEIKEKLTEIYSKIELKNSRPSWDEYFMKATALVAERSTCLRRHIGAIIVKDKKLITTGYNGAAKDMKDCMELGCLRDELGIASGTRHEICRAIHAEQNAIIQAAFHGTSIKEGVLYCTHTPCMICSKMIVNAGITEIVTYQDYSDQDAIEFLKEAGIKLRKINRPNQYIEFKD